MWAFPGMPLVRLLWQVFGWRHGDSKFAADVWVRYEKVHQTVDYGVWGIDYEALEQSICTIV